MQSRDYATFVCWASVRLFLCPSVPPIRLPHADAAGLLLWARRAGDIDGSWQPLGASAAWHVVGECG